MRFDLLNEYYNGPVYLGKLRERLAIIADIEKNPVKRLEYQLKWSKDPIAFIEQFGFIKIPEYNNAIKPFFLFEYQKRVIQKIKDAEDSNQEHEILVDKPRGMGLTWIIVWYQVWKWATANNWTGFDLSRSEAEVDDGSDNPDSSIFGKLRWCIAKLPKWMKEGYRPKGKKGTQTDSNLKIVNPQAENTIVGSTTNANAGRSRRYSFIFVDECFSIERFNEVWRSLQSVARVKVFVTTVKQGKVFLDFKDMCDKAGDYISLSWRDHPFKDQQWYEEMIKKAEFDPEVMKEIEVDYAVNIRSQYYPEIRQAKCVSAMEYNRKLPLYVSLDFGAQDLTVIIWWQYENGEFKCFNAYANSRKPLDWYAPFLNPQIEFDPLKYNEFQQKLLSDIRSWERPKAYFGEVAHFQKMMPLNRSIAEELIKWGIRLMANQYAVEYEVRRHTTSSLLPKTVFNMQAPYVSALYDAISNSRYSSSIRAVGSKATALKPAHDKETADYRSAAENFYVNIARVLRTQREDYQRRPPEDRGFMSSIVKNLKI